MNDKIAQVIEPGNGKKKAIVVPIEAIEGLAQYWRDYTYANDIALLPCNRVNPTRESWEKLCKTVHHAFAYGLECNDMTHNEVIEDIAFALDCFADLCDFPRHDWDTDYNELYPVEDEDDNVG